MNKSIIVVDLPLLMVRLLPVLTLLVGVTWGHRPIHCFSEGNLLGASTEYID